MDLIIAFLIVRQPDLHAPLDIASRYEDDSAIVLQSVVDSDEVVKDRICQLIPFVEYE